MFKTLLRGRSSLSSPKALTELPSGCHVFIDANIFIYHFTQSPLTAPCTAFLQRVEMGDIQGVTSVVTLTEVAHRLMILEAIQTFGLASRTAVRTLKQNSAFVQQLQQYKIATEKIPDFHVVVKPITSAHLRTAQSFSGTYGLLTNDSLIAAVMQTLSLTDIVSNDSDLSVVMGLTIWQPRPPSDVL